MSTHTIQNQIGKISVDTEGGYVTEWKLSDKNILYQGSELKRTGIPILFPQFGKSHKLPQHGFGRNCTWHFIKQTENEIILMLTDQNIPEEMKLLYPYQFRNLLTITLTEDGDLIYKLDVTNDSEQTMPISPGIHPYWAVDHAQKRQVTIADIPDFKAAKIDWDTNPPDTAFPFSGKVEINFPDKILTIEDTTENGPANTLLQVWSQPIVKPDYNFICFEPITRDNFALEENPIMIKEGETWSMELQFSVIFT